MHTFEGKRGFQAPVEVDADIASLDQLSADLKALRGGRPPDPDALRRAPLIDSWVRGMRTSHCIVGMTARDMGQPVNTPIITTELWIDASNDGWIRTFTSFYRLASPGDAQAIERYARYAR